MEKCEKRAVGNGLGKCLMDGRLSVGVSGGVEVRVW